MLMVPGRYGDQRADALCAQTGAQGLDTIGRLHRGRWKGTIHSTERWLRALIEPHGGMDEDHDFSTLCCSSFYYTFDGVVSLAALACL